MYRRRGLKRYVNILFDIWESKCKFREKLSILQMLMYNLTFSDELSLITTQTIFDGHHGLK